MWPPFFLRSLFLSGPTCRADHLREVGRLSGGLLICLLCVGAVSFCAAGVFQGLPWACLALVSADVWGKTQQKRSFMYIGGGAVGLWSQLTCICGGPRSPLHRGPSFGDARPALKMRATHRGTIGGFVTLDVQWLWFLMKLNLATCSPIESASCTIYLTYRFDAQPNTPNP